MTSAYRKLPAVDTLVQLLEQRFQEDSMPRHLLVNAARQSIDTARKAVTRGEEAPSTEELADVAFNQARVLGRPSLRPVINGTGVIIQTNLGRAPLSHAAIQAMEAVGTGYSNLEYDLEMGARGSRTTHVTALLCHLTGAEAALIVNNNAAAIYLTLITLAAGREVVVSRGQAVEIGGGFRIPDVLRQSGATLVEVGTTNRTYVRDYAAALSLQTALLMRIHTSNFRLMGFVHETPLHELSILGQAHAIPVLDDLGSGTLLSTQPYGLAPEPTVQESVQAGADLITFSGDKLLGGPQAGLIVGQQTLITQLRQHPLARAVRVDKTTLAGLEATLLAYLNNRAPDDIPVWRMIAAAPDQLQKRTERLVALLGSEHATVVESTSAIGGGSLPGETLPSFAIALTSQRPDKMAHRLRLSNPPVIGRIVEDRLLFDVRTILNEQEEAFIEIVRQAVLA
ncbi:MAG: L-seryl-tRNA(Sec) selenium transferase [Chloroflexi bacterium AL-W]|nr:L-seryl-tRNA(Sec) selenium transferase [Chloroflexi bacterium AL-N1]NOK65204.1 L-seryl-tRNA(Sec) selenium transferase [Chloroflexi bacterium AL-N10]NOK72531.1 L-seryl-tRNA(Sec) selenium transferase [Chloroflexi bacterium AL-N5]NOK79383.1 L-seryl-tRNA(Sec) selenium transferase [Chloroflexi bacterium AL-W]NOK87299.1 L-seryl-tRNA(Sec) selenium transferase [Chloroflexi bacterium AL-N15]